MTGTMTNPLIDVVQNWCHGRVDPYIFKLHPLWYAGEISFTVDHRLSQSSKPPVVYPDIIMQIIVITVCCNSTFLIILLLIFLHFLYSLHFSFNPSSTFLIYYLFLPTLILTIPCSFLCLDYFAYLFF